MLAPKTSMYVKKKATDPAANDLPLDVSSAWDRSAATIIMEKESPADPHIMVDLRPILSNARVGRSEPMGNMS
jgi:hypothetical protein